MGTRDRVDKKSGVIEKSIAADLGNNGAQKELGRTGGELSFPRGRQRAESVLNLGRPLVRVGEK